MKTLFALALGLLVGAGPAAAQPAASSANPGRTVKTAAEDAVLPAAKGPAVLAYTGVLELQRKGSSAVEIVKKAPLRIGEGDRLATADGEARIRTIDGSQVHLEAGTQITIGEQKSDMIIVRVLAGKVWAKVVKLKSRRFEVRSDAAVASVRGTEFSMAVLGPRSAVTEVQEGLVSVRALLNDRPVGAERMVGAGQSVKVLGGKIGLAETLQGMIINSPNAEGRVAANAAAAQSGRLASSPAELRATFSREVGQQLGREAVQRAAAGASAAPQSAESASRLTAAASETREVSVEAKGGAVFQGTGVMGPTGGGAERTTSGTLGFAETIITADDTNSKTGTADPGQSISVTDPAIANVCPTCPRMR